MSRYRIHSPVLAAAVLLAFALPLTVRAQSYQVVDLGQMQPMAINASGEVVGSIAGQAAMYSDGVTTTLSIAGSATAVNDAGEIAGNIDGGGAFLYSGGTVTDLTSTESAVGINDAGQIAVSAGEDSYIYYNQVLTPLSVPYVVQNYPTAINSEGQVVGRERDGSTYAGYLYSNGTMTDLGRLSAPYNYESDALGINSAGEVVGYSEGTSVFQVQAFLYSNGAMSDFLGTLGGTKSEATGINDSGQIVGYTDDGGFLYSNGVMTNLDAFMPVESGVQLDFQPSAINDNGWIVGQGVGGQEQDDGFLLIPAPEPTALATLTIGAGLALVRRRNLTIPIATH